MNRSAKFISLFFAVFAAFFPFLVSALTVTDISDQISSSQISIGSNHTFTMTVPDDVAEGETVQITFPTGFSLTLITEDDVDITDDGVDLSTAVNCASNEAASVSIAGQAVTITPCVGDGGAIALGSIVTIEIGTNASFSGLGTQRITNPTVVSSWFVNLSGTSGNSGSIILETTVGGAASVSATIPAHPIPPGGGGGSGGLPGPTPPTPPAPPEEESEDVPAEPIAPEEAPSEEPAASPDDSSGAESPADAPSGGSEGTGSESSESFSGTSSSGGGGSSGGGESEGGGSGGGSTSGSSSSDVAAISESSGGSAVENADVPAIEDSQDSTESSAVVVGPIAPPVIPKKTTTTTRAVAKVEETVAKVQETIANILIAVEEIRALPEVKQAVSIAIPVASVAVAATTVVLVSSFNLLSYLQFLFTAPFLLFARRKRKAFGIVYNSVTKVAIELATVRLYDAVTNRLVRSAVTDASGKYFFIANPGQYRLSVKKNAWTFPSSYLNGVKDDGVYLDVYSGQTITVTEKDATIAANIPLDYVEDAAKHTKQGMLNRRVLRKLQFGFSISGVFLSAGIWFLSPSVLTMFLALGQIIAFAFCLRLAKAKRSRGWGIVYDSVTRRPVGNAIVRLFEPKYNKLVESTLTDTLGRYSFLVGPNEYFVRTDKPGYDEHIVRPIDYRQKTEPSAIAIDVPLTPTKPV